MPPGNNSNGSTGNAAFVPPAVQPPRVISAAEWISLMQRQARLTNSNNNNNNRNNNNYNYDDEDDDEDLGPRSPITIRVSAGIRVHGEKNLVGLAEADGPGHRHPADAAQTVADAVVRAIAGRGCEVPMIDEEGRPRPLRVEVDATIDVRGQGNVLGGREMLLRVMGGRKRQREGEEDGEGEGERSAPGTEGSRQEQEQEQPEQQQPQPQEGESSASV